MVTVAVDTNIVTKILRGNISDIDHVLKRIDLLYIPWVVHGELMSGIKAGGNPAKYSVLAEQFLNETHVMTSKVVASDTVPFYAEIYADLRRRGTPVSPNDLWIAAECAQAGLPILSLDTDFELIPHVLRFT